MVELMYTQAIIKKFLVDENNLKLMPMSTSLVCVVGKYYYAYKRSSTEGYIEVGNHFDTFEEAMEYRRSLIAKRIENIQKELRELVELL